VGGEGGDQRAKVTIVTFEHYENLEGRLVYRGIANIGGDMRAYVFTPDLETDMINDEGRAVLAALAVLALGV
jgi:hypothetical protein